ncbi:MAG: DNA methyltransferase [Candidatus Methanomethylicia archaeon]
MELIIKNLDANFRVDMILNRVIHGDCLEIMKKLPSEIVDMVFFDPPYFLQLPDNKRLIRWEVKTEVESPEEYWDKFSSFQEYDEFITKSLNEIRRLMKHNATIWAIGTYHNIHRIGKIMQDLGFWILNDVIWFKTNPMPNWLGVRLTNSTETIIWATKDKNSKKYTFNKDIAREYSNRDWGKKLAYNVWKLPICMGKERLKNNEGKRLHPTQKPEELLERIILISTKPNDIVFDPMAGTGTTGVIARRCGRNFIMIEKEQKYIEAIMERLINSL